jgi:hypothetical protein
VGDVGRTLFVTADRWWIRLVDPRPLSCICVSSFLFLLLKHYLTNYAERNCGIVCGAAALNVSATCCIYIVCTAGTAGTAASPAPPIAPVSAVSDVVSTAMDGGIEEKNRNEVVAAALPPCSVQSPRRGIEWAEVRLRKEPVLPGAQTSLVLNVIWVKHRRRWVLVLVVLMMVVVVVPFVVVAVRRSLFARIIFSFVFRLPLLLLALFVVLVAVLY